MMNALKASLTNTARAWLAPWSSQNAQPQIFRAAQLELLLSQMPMMAVVSAAVAVAFIVAMAEVAPLWQCGLWLAAMLTLSGWQFAKARSLAAILDPERVSDRAIRQATLHAFILAAPWSLACLFFFPSGAEAHQIFLAFVLGGMMAGAVATLSPLPTVAHPYILALAIPLILRFLLVGDRLHLLMGLMLVIYTAGLLVASRIGFDRFCKLVQAQADLEDARLDLLDAIECSEEAFAFYNPHGKAVLRNRRHRDIFGDGDSGAQPTIESGRIHQHTNGRWLQSSVRRTARGGRVAVHSDISSLKARQAELEEARDRADAADRAKSEFLALMSHELRTPLNAILGFSQMIERNLKPEANAEYAASIHGSGKHLLAIINDILDLSKIESGTLFLEDGPVDIAHAVDEICEKTAPIAAEKSITVAEDPASGWPVLLADERAVRQMLLNLVSNGVKFTPTNGQVTISAEWPEGEFVLAVHDTGIGIAAPDIPKIFEAFQQVESSLARNQSGTGLGVPIVDRLARKHGGRLTYESQLGTGTIARIHFPRSRVLNPASVLAGIAG